MSTSPTPAQVADVRNTFLAVARSLKRIAAYRHAEEKFLEFLTPALDSLTELLARHGPLEVTVEPTALLLGEESVYGEAAREWSLCFRLHRDGVRALRFDPGITAAELMVMVSIALPEPTGVDGGREDAITELWKADLAHLAWTASPGWRFDASHEDRARLAASAVNAQGALGRMSSVLDPGVEDAARLAPPLCDEATRRTLDHDDWGDLVGRAALTVCRIVESRYAGRDLENLQESLGLMLDEMLRRGASSPLATTLEVLAGLGDPGRAELSAPLGERLSHPTRLEELAKLCEASMDAFTFVLPPYLALLPGHAGEVLLKTFDATPAPGVRFGLAHAAAVRLAGCVDAYRQRLRDAEPEQVRELLAALSSAPAQLRADVAAAALGNRSDAVRVDAVVAVAADPPAALRHLPPLLDDRLQSVRIAVATSLGETGPAAVPPLLAATGKPGFALAEHAEREALYVALGTLGSPEALTFLESRLEKRGLFFDRKGDEEDQLVAVRGLAAAMVPRALDALDRAGKPDGGASATVSAAARAAAAHIRRHLARRSAP